MNLLQLNKSHSNVSPLFKDQDLSLVLRLSGIEVFEDHVRIFYVNLRISQDSCEFETLVLSTRIILNDFVFEKIFDAKLSEAIPFLRKQKK